MQAAQPPLLYIYIYISTDHMHQETYEVVAGSIPEIESNAEAAHLGRGSH